ncbi:hypothetical protein D9613_011958 [Agrocybe pediades]|uniref:Uncharacterized protein n=1 Tax=Agrocybe pediades TaxID=84607 RepID=A0A8H4VJ34_9AGAR|nr:hypothetical protein D9613_011958 [Agrocybe pediades]
MPSTSKTVSPNRRTAYKILCAAAKRELTLSRSFGDTIETMPASALRAAEDLCLHRSWWLEHHGQPNCLGLGRSELRPKSNHQKALADRLRLFVVVDFDEENCASGDDVKLPTAE